MKIELTEKQFRRLLDLVYIGNWVLNSTRGDDRIREYDEVESTVSPTASTTAWCRWSSPIRATDPLARLRRGRHP